MWHIIKSEIDYNKKLVLFCLTFIPLICLYELWVPGTREGYTLLIIYGMLAFWISFRNKERRGLQHVQLPLSMKQLALTRLIMVFAISLSIGILYYLNYFLFNFSGPAQPEKLIIYGCIILFGSSLYFIIIDLRGKPSEKFRYIKSRVKAVLILLIGGMSFLTFYAIFQMKRTGEAPALLRYLDTINLIFDPPVNHQEMAIFLMLSLILASFTVFTFCRRKSYLE